VLARSLIVVFPLVLISYMLPIVVSLAIIYSIFSWGDFKSLVVIDIWVILGGMFLEFLALAKLRYSRLDLPRHFRVPGEKSDFGSVSSAR